MVAAQSLLQTLHSTATNWLARQLSQLVADLNSISAKEVREFDEKLRLDNGPNWQSKGFRMIVGWGVGPRQLVKDPSLYRLQHEDGAEVGRHFGLMVASIKSKVAVIFSKLGQITKSCKAPVVKQSRSALKQRSTRTTSRTFAGRSVCDHVNVRK